jgi:hypothetical protein
MWGRVVDRAQVRDDALTEEEGHWLEADLANLESAPLVLDRLPPVIDLLVLDGGEFTTYGEFHLLHPRVSAWILLDDTRTRKCRDILEEVRAGQVPQWIIVDESQERNGVAVLRRLGGRATEQAIP